MLRSTCLVVISLVAFACAKDTAKDKEQSAPPPAPQVAKATAAAEGSGSVAGSAAAGSAAAGSAAAGSAAGSAATGSGAPAEGSGAPAEGSAAPAEGSAAAGASDFHFDKLTHDEKVKFMKQKVMPTMKPLFQKFDAKEFASFTCKTCHGKDPAKRKYEMPTPDLPALDFDAIKAGKEDPKMVEFMSKVVKPEMAKLLNEPEMSEAQPKGFGCLECHEMKKM